jgi:5-methyltetrahydropteroyltriglutamate--homocysteine methyltransferase
MAQRTKAPFRADHVGSLCRPEALMRARERLLGPHDRDNNFGPHTNAELAALEDEAIREAVKRQESAGMRAITDGEFRRRIWWCEFLGSLDNVVCSYHGEPEFRDESGNALPSPHVDVTGKIRWKGSVNAGPYKFLRSLTTGTPKVTLPAPQSVYHFARRESVDRAAYPEMEMLWDDLAAAYIAEIKALGEAGCTYVQFDEITTTCLCDDRQRAKFSARGKDPERTLRAYGACLNRIAAARPEGMTLALHTCRGNMRGRWLAEGGYDPVAEYVFGEIAVDAFFLEYDTPRAGGFEPLRFVGKGKIAVLGLVSTKTPELESTDMLARRIDAAARFLPLDQMALSPQCGFSSNYLGNPITADDERRKLELVVKVAEQVWGTA